MLICLAVLAILLKITFIIQKENKKKKSAASESRGLINYHKISSALPVVPSQRCSYSRQGSAEGFGWQSHPGCLAQGVRGSWPLHAALPESRAAERRKLRPADVTDTYACHQQKGRGKKSWRGSNLLSSSRFGRWGTPQDCYSFRAVFVSVPLLDCYCYQKVKK